MRAYLACFVALVGIAAACSGPKEVERVGPGGGNNQTSGGSAGSGTIDLDAGVVCDPYAPGSPCGPDAPAPPGCGDGTLTSDEACDDGNLEHGDGCAANCLLVEPGFSCNPPGQPCREIAKCGDGVVSGGEPCDDGNVAAGDGCSPRCKFEIGFKCDGEPSVCTPTVCGDGVKEGAESCEDGNAVPFDGCSSLCQTEPDCSQGACVSACGDGLVLNEDCDDGNAIDGDGCSSTCTVEEGFECSVDLGCEMINDKCVLRVPVVFRDFDAAHADFAAECKGAMGGMVAQTGLVAEDLVNGKPAPAAAGAGEAGGCITALGEWYTDAVATPIVGDIVLFDNGNGGFVNRFGPNGEQWSSKPVYTSRWCGNDDTGCMADPATYFDGCNFDPATELCDYPCDIPGGPTGGSCAYTVTVDAWYDGTPLFFPVDDQPVTEEWIDAKIPPQYGYEWPYEDQVLPVEGAPHVEDAVVHNFHFTTEVVYWFKYDAAVAARLDFTGDDDVWVFVNGKLAVDLGGVHQPVDGGVTIDATTAGTYGLEDGQVYKITIFHAERLKESSSFRLTLAGFKATRSECAPVCGDGILGLGEQCDDGVNDGGYGECAAGCVLGEYCGDGIVQEGEDCDDGNTFDGDMCGSACRILVVK